MAAQSKAPHLRAPRSLALHLSANRRSAVSLTLAISATLCIGLSGCKSATPAADDSAVSKNVQTLLATDNSIAGQPIHASVQRGVVTITGSVANDAQRTLAARDAAAIAGVREVVNNITVEPQPQAQAVNAPPMQMTENVKPSPAFIAPVPESRRAMPDRSTRTRPSSAPIERPGRTRPEPRNGDRDTSSSIANTHAPEPTSPTVAAGPPPPPPPPPAPTFRNLTVAAGNTLPVRVTQTLDSGTTQPGASFAGVVASDILVEGIVAIPAGSSVSGRVDAVQDAAHFRGSSMLTVSLSSLNRRGDRIPLSTEPYSVEGKARGRNTVEKTAGGAAVGAILGGIFGGGKGAAIGAAAGGGVGAGANAITRGEQVQIASETVVRFHLTSPVSLRVRTDDNTPEPPADTGLQRRPNP
jgi:hypothetical protein